MANGGQGAPLPLLFHQEFFEKSDHNRAIINIGGMTNITLLPKTGACSAYDIGPEMFLWTTGIKDTRNEV